MRKFKVTVNGVSYDVCVEEVDSSVPEQNDKETEQVSKPNPVTKQQGKVLSAPMPGTIVDVKVKTGDTVKSGQVVIILEAMKMENEITMPFDGVVSEIKVSKGTAVKTGDIMIVVG